MSLVSVSRTIILQAEDFLLVNFITDVESRKSFKPNDIVLLTKDDPEVCILFLRFEMLGE